MGYRDHSAHARFRLVELVDVLEDEISRIEASELNVRIEPLRPAIREARRAIRRGHRAVDRRRNPVAAQLALERATGAVLDAELTALSKATLGDRFREASRLGKERALARVPDYTKPRGQRDGEGSNNNLLAFAVMSPVLACIALPLIGAITVIAIAGALFSPLNTTVRIEQPEPTLAPEYVVEELEVMRDEDLV